MMLFSLNFALIAFPTILFLLISKECFYSDIGLIGSYAENTLKFLLLWLLL